MALATLMGCAPEEWPEPPPIELDRLLQEHDAWRADRERRLVTPPGGAVLWNGLFPLSAGDNPFGSDPSLAITLPAEDSPPFAGILRRRGQVVTLVPEPGSEIRVRGVRRATEGGPAEAPVTSPLVLEDDGSGDPTVLSLGSLGMRVHTEPGTDRLWLRTWDEDSPLIQTFRLPESYPVSDQWRVTARFREYREPLMLRFADVRGGLVEYRAPGELRFRKDGREHSLIATAGEDATSFFIIMWDSTATENTYQGGRYLRAPLPDENGFTTIDFNRAYNAPCVFTAFSVCALPPPENRLTLHVTAGEQRPQRPYY